MNKNQLYYLGLTVLAGLLFAGYFVIKDKLPFQTPLIIAAFYTITAVSHHLLIRAMTHNPQKFQTNFMMAMGFKMLAYLFFLAISHFLVAPINLSFVLVFFANYMVFVVYEMVAMQRFKNQS
jgi:hypothetical protein